MFDKFKARKNAKNASEDFSENEYGVEDFAGVYDEYTPYESIVDGNAPVEALEPSVGDTFTAPYTSSSSVASSLVTSETIRESMGKGLFKPTAQPASASSVAMNDLLPQIDFSYDDFNLDESSQPQPQPQPLASAPQDFEGDLSGVFVENAQTRQIGSYILPSDFEGDPQSVQPIKPQGEEPFNPYDYVPRGTKGGKGNASQVQSQAQVQAQVPRQAYFGSPYVDPEGENSRAALREPAPAQTSHAGYGFSRELRIVRPLSYNDAELITLAVKEGAVCILLVDGVPEDLGLRLLDFSFGVASALGAFVEAIGPQKYALMMGDSLSEAERSTLRFKGVL